jgi:four helix bundle protein
VNRDEAMTMTTTTTNGKNKLRILDDCAMIMREVFLLTLNHPEFRYTINEQLIRSTLSIGSNIAEGNQRRGKDRNQHFNIALGSLEESRFQLLVYPDYKSNLDDIYDKIRATILRLQECDCSAESSSQSSSQSESD